MTRTRPRRPRWRCHVDGCNAWGFADVGEQLADLQHAHYLEHHYVETSEEADD